MRHLLACLAILAAFSVTAQVDGFQLPYNPDVEPDGYIGVQDILELLQLYGSEFNAELYFDEDSTSIVMEVGIMGVFECLVACDDLPSNWTLANMTDFGRALPSLDNATFLVQDKMISATRDLGSDHYSMNLFKVTKNSSGQITMYAMNQAQMESPVRCLCAAHERPKVEYLTCSSSSNAAFVECCQNRVAEGWYPLSSNPISTGQLNVSSQAFWRWAD